jgi:signal peptidase I
VYVNGKRLPEPYLPQGTKTYAAETADEFTCCGQDQVYVLGDNRGISRDSRYFGAITRDNIVGKLIH